jgi:hypothetical protein
MGLKKEAKEDIIFQEIEGLLEKGTGVELEEKYIRYLEKQGRYTSLELPNEKQSSLRKIKGYSLDKLTEIYSDLVEDERIHMHGSAFCLEPCCLHRFFRLTHKGSKIRKENFFFAWLILLTSKLKSKNDKSHIVYDWKLAEEIMFQITLGEFPKASNKAGKYQIMKRYKKAILEAWWGKIWLFYKATSDIRFAFPKDYELIGGSAKRFRKFADKAIDYIVKEKHVSQRQLGRAFSKTKEDVELLLGELDSHPNFNWDKNKKRISYLEKSARK